MRKLLPAIVSMSTFLGKSQKIFQQRFNDKVPLSKHAHFFKWGALSLLIAQLYPLLYAHVAKFGIQAINDKVMAGAKDANAVSWKTLMLAGPLFLVFGFLVLLWASQTFRALKFLIKYKPKAALEK